jgi:large subunit ribosomal protein L15
MKYHELEVKRFKNKKRVGRGISAGQGKTAGRGTKGQNSRKSGPPRPGFEGGQTPLSQRLPKLRSVAKGSLARSAKKAKAQNVYTGELNQFANKIVDNFTLADAGLITTPYCRVKLIVKGKIENKVTVNLEGASKSAVEAIIKAGGAYTKTKSVFKNTTKQK